MNFVRLELSNCETVPINGEELLKPKKAFQNQDWLTTSKAAKPLRVLSELVETEERLKAANITSTILFFGSARSKFSTDITKLSSRKELSDNEKVTLKRIEWMAPVMANVCELSRRLTEWSMSRLIECNGIVPYVVATGGGPGMMEAANKGASLVEDALSIGMGISLPFETGINMYCTPELSFEYNYFFTRKFCMVSTSRAFIATPGGFGTFDELFEVLTLLQNGKIEYGELFPVVLFGKDFWETSVNWKKLEEFGVISKSDIDRLYFTDSIDEAFEYISTKLLQYETAKKESNLIKKASEEAASSRASEQYRDHTRRVQSLEKS